MKELTLENVSYQYPGALHLALDHIAGQFVPGTVTAVTGPSGSGKTTLLSLLAGLDRPTDGQVLLNGDDLQSRDLDEYRRQEVSVIFQAFQLFPLLTVLENVCYPMELNGIPLKQAKRRARQLLHQVGIQQEQWKRFPANLSGGEQQRVAIARALASGAEILLADEPTGNLDEINSKNVVDILTALAHQEHYCVIIVTHDPAIAERADLVYRMSDGKMRATGEEGPETADAVATPGKERIQLSGKEEILDFEVEEILYFEGSASRQVLVHTAGGQVVPCRGKLASLEQALAPKGFLRIQKSYLVNMSHIRRIKNYLACLDNGEELKTTERNYRQICDSFLNWPRRQQ